MNGEFDWAIYADENSNASMQSADFSELPLAKLDCSRDLGLDFSREGLNLKVSEILNVESNSNSLKRSRGHSDGLPKLDVKRPKTEQQGSETSAEVGKNVEKAQLNFAEILKATKGSDIAKKGPLSNINTLDESNGMTVESNIILHVGSGGETELGNIKDLDEYENKESGAQLSQTNVRANVEPQRWLDTRRKMEAKIFQAQKAEEREICQESKLLKKLEKERGGKLLPAVQETNKEINSAITNSNRSPDLVWCGEQSTKFLGVAGKAKKNYVTPDSECEFNAPSISSLSTTHTHVQSSESISMATSESDMNTVSVSTVSSPTSSITRSQPAAFSANLLEKPNMEVLTQNYHPIWAAYNPSCALQFGAVRGNSSCGRKSLFKNGRGKVVMLSKHQVDRRLRQLSIGKQSWGYQNYVRAVPKNSRSWWHPITPDPLERISKRRFNGKVNVWRRKLHYWDAPRNLSFAPLAHESIESVKPAILAFENEETKIKHVGGDEQMRTRDGETQLHDR